MTPTTIAFAVAAPLILWRVYARVKRLMTRQRSQAWRHWIAMVLFPLVVIGFAFAAHAYPLTLAALAGGVVAGAALAALGLRKTGFEQVGAEFFFTPHAGIGIAVSLVFISRMGYRMVEVIEQGPAYRDDFGHSPLTLLAFGVLAGYYTVYAAGLLRWRRRAALAN